MNEVTASELEQLRKSRIFVAGHGGMVGAALTRKLGAAGCSRLLLRTRSELDLTSQSQVERFFSSEQPEYVFLAAAKVGGIQANNSYPADFIYDNLAIAANVIRTAHRHGVHRMLFLGSSCIYPRLAPQPMAESALLTGPLEATNEPYAVAKIAGIKLCESFNRQYGTDFRSLMPTNLYGPQDNFDLETSHVLPALIRKFDEARRAAAEYVEIWGTGRPRREFLHVDDLADACLFVMTQPFEAYTRFVGPMLSHVNVGTGEDISIRELAELVATTVDFHGEIRLNPEYPDGTPRKLLDVSKLGEMGWSPSISLREGISRTYSWYLQHVASSSA